MAARKRAGTHEHDQPAAGSAGPNVDSVDDQLDRANEDSFPASDPPAIAMPHVKNNSPRSEPADKRKKRAR
jgi:hypothetical protein